MMRIGRLGILLITMTLFCTGCWDRIEINDIALVMASSIDLDDNGKYVGALQMVIPARQIGNTSQNAKPYFVESGTGDNIQQMIASEQPKLSRRLFVAHRRVVFIGEKLARHGLKDILDHFGRNPTTRLRTFVVLVKGAQGIDALNVDYPLEFVPTEAVREMEKLVGGTAVTMRDLFQAASGEGIEPMMGVVELTRSADKVKGGNARKTFDLTGTAVFKDLKLVGYLNTRDTQLMLWVTGKLKDSTLSVKLPEQKGTVSVSLGRANRTITPSVKDGKVKFAIHLKGQGMIEENKSNLDFGDPKYLRMVEESLVQSVRGQTLGMIERVQKKYDSDILGFGEVLHKKNPKEWRKIRHKWDEVFADAEFIVTADFTVTRSGMTGPSLHLHEQEIVK
jgi:spore germination protein KC